MADENLDNETLYLVSGRKLKELLKKGKTKGVNGEIVVQERGKDTHIGFASVKTMAAVVDGKAGFYRVPAQLDKDAGTEDQAKTAIKTALGITSGIPAGYEEVLIRGVVVSGSSMVAETITILKKTSA